MPRIDLMRFLLCSATATVSFAFWGPLAQAGYVCPNGPGAGEVQVGTVRGGDGVSATAPVYPVCEKSGSTSGSGSSTSGVDPLQSRINTAVSAIEGLGANLEEQKKLINDPKYQAYFNGVWDFFPNKAPGGSCGALFSKLDGLILLGGPSKDSPNALLTFFGENIPRPKEAEKIKVALTQDNYPPQTVQAVNFVPSGMEYGAIAFAVPIEAALAEMKDVESFDLSIEGKSVLKIKWNGGLAVRDKFRECEKARVKK